MVKKRLTDGLTLISVNNTGIKSAGVACRGSAGVITKLSRFLA
jgi:hypothetical protein